LLFATQEIFFVILSIHLGFNSVIAKADGLLDSFLPKPFRVFLGILMVFTTADDIVSTFAGARAD
jgi:hypothetical protein